MHIGLRSTLLAATATLALAPTALADTAIEPLVLARDACTTGGGGSPRLDWSTGAFTSGCSSDGFQTAVATTETLFPTAKAVAPFTLDAARTIHIEIRTGEYVSGGPLGPIGPEKVRVRLFGKLVGSSATTNIGDMSYTSNAQDIARANKYTVSFEMPIPPAAAGTYKSVTLGLTVNGAALGGYVDMGGSTFVNFPIPGDVDAAPPEA